MRCAACDRLLEDFETSRKSDVDGKYEDLCNSCYKEVKADLDGMTGDYFSIKSDRIDFDLMNLLGIE